MKHELSDLEINNMDIDWEGREIFDCCANGQHALLKIYQCIHTSPAKLDDGTVIDMIDKFLEKLRKDNNEV